MEVEREVKKQSYIKEPKSLLDCSSIEEEEEGEEEGGGGG